MMISSIDLALLAARMLKDFDKRVPGTAFGEGLRLSLDDAWRLQGAVAALREQRGERVVGYKIGCICEVCQKANGLLHPVWGRLWSTEQYESGVRLSKKNFANVGIEGEFAVTLNRDIEPGSITRESVVQAVDRVFPVIELHHLVMRGMPPRGHELIANNAVHAGVVRGPGIDLPDGPLSTDLRLFFDGKTIDQWLSLVWPGDILREIVWIVNKLAEFGQKLKKGDTLLTGAFGLALPLGDAEHVQVTSSAFGMVEAIIK